MVTADPWASPEGYGVVDLLDAATVEQLLAAVHQKLGPASDAFWASSAQAPRATASDIDRWIKQELALRLGHLLPGTEPFLAAVITKAGPDGCAVSFHQDWTYTDEREHRAVLAWIPLVDVDEGSGAMRVVPGSHRWVDGIRPGGAPLPTDAFQDRFAERATTVVMRAGQALVYDPALVHGSWPNRVERDRPVLAVASAPLGAELWHFHVAPDGALDGYVIDPSYYTQQEFSSVPPGPPRGAWSAAVTVDDLGRALERP